MQIRFRPIQEWPEPRTGGRKDTPFFATWAQTLQLLESELEKLGASEVVIEVAMRESDIRIDGWPKGNAVATHPGVIVSFDSRHGPLRYLTDTFSHWQANVRAIALALEALRKVDRYGISRRGEQYRGWKALPAGVAEGEAMTVEAAARFVAQHSDDPPGRLVDVEADPSFALVLYKEAAKRLHPDAGGDAEQFRLLQVARQTLEAFGT